MKKSFYLTITAFVALLVSSCSSSLLVTSGAKSNEPLIFHDEYKFDSLKSISVEGRAIFGIPTSEHLGPYKNKNGFLFTFNNVEVGRTSRIKPILSMLILSYYSARLVQTVAGEKKEYIQGVGKVGTGENKLKFAPAWILGLPISGAMNNFVWQTSAFSGASSCFRYRLIEENPGVDLFVYPKYKVEYNSGLWTQRSTLTGSAIGATLILNKPKPVIAPAPTSIKPAPISPIETAIPVPAVPTKPKK